jgi:hypothetical protein
MQQQIHLFFIAPCIFIVGHDIIHASTEYQGFFSLHLAKQVLPVINFTLIHSKMQNPRYISSNLATILSVQ